MPISLAHQGPYSAHLQLGGSPQAIVDRVSTPRITLSEAYQPRAEIVDAYVRPATPAKSDLWDLAEGLQVFSSSLKGLMAGRKATDEANAKALGEAQFYKNNSVGYAEAVRTGKLPSFQSPEFVSAYKKAEGSLMGKRMVSKFELEYSTWDGRNGQDPAAFDTFVADFISRNLTSDDPDVLDGAMPYVGQLTERGYSLNTQERADGLYNGSIDAHIASSDQDVDLAVMSGTASGQGADKATLWEALLANREAALSTGIRDEDYDKKLIDLVIFKAQESGDDDLLTLLDNTVPGTTHTYATTQYGREQIAAAETGIEVAKRQAEERSHTAQTRADAAMKDQMEAFVVEKLAADPNYVFDEAFLVEYQKYDPQARINLRDWSKKLAEGIPEDGEAVLELYDRVLKGEDPGAVARSGMSAGVIRTPETLKGIIGFKGDQKETNRFTQNPVYKTSLGALRQAAMPKDEFATWFNPDAASPAAVAIQLDYEKAMTRFLQQNPQASDLEISEESARVYGILSKGISEPGQYATPTEAGVDDNPLVPSQLDVETDAAEEAALAASPAGQMDVWAGDAPPTLDQLPPEEAKALEDAAAAMGGIDPAVLLERTWQRVQEIIDAEEANEAVGSGIDAILDGAGQEEPPAEQGLNLSDAIVDPAVHQVEPILNLLGVSEGTDRGDAYNETLGYGAYTGGDVELTGMTLKEVRKLQRKMLAHPDNSWNSSAVGRYQIVGKTLASLMRKMGLSGDELFTAELQDRMALELLRGRGLEKWMAGDISTKRFIANIAKEWASLPKADGSKTYGNQGLGTDATTLIAALHSINRA